MRLLAPRRLASHATVQTGFTIVELLIVIVVIAILAAITIVSYNGITQRAIDSSLQSDLRNAQNTIFVAELDGPIPTDSSSFKASNGATFQYSYDTSENPSYFCITATIKTRSFYIDRTIAPTLGSCPGHLNGGQAPTPNWVATNSGNANYLAGAMSDDGQKLAIGANPTAYIQTSQDGGNTWTTNGNSSGAFSWAAMTSTPDFSTIYALKATGGVVKSTNNGVTWTTMSSPATSNWKEVVTSNSGAVVVASTFTMSPGVHVSRDSGVTWAFMPAMPLNANVTDVALSDDGKYLYAVSSTGSVYLSTYTSAWSAWVELPSMAVTSSQTGSASMIDVSADGSKVVYSSGNSTTVKISSDYGATSVSVTYPSTRLKGDLKASANATQLIARSSSGFIYLSFDGGYTWVEQNTPVMIDGAYGAIDVSSNGTKFMAGRLGGPILKATF